ncbi:hypothetical protein [Cellulosimicrobium sp. NPDC057127]|uniref:hypothetical protein n=1 Tax=Cellulosimicrobium sp. NPDC057127 TaxID=3346026 RepID=UPI003632F81E
MTTGGANSRLYAIMTGAAHRVLAPLSIPYEVGRDAATEIARGVIDTADLGGLAYRLWAELTDVADHPRVNNPALCDERSRMAASEWLRVDITDDTAIMRYFERWNDPIKPREVPASPRDDGALRPRWEDAP